MPAPGSGFRCELVTLEEVYEISLELARRIRSARFQPDLVVAIARGGFVPARLLCDFLGVDALASLRIRHYAAGAHREERARVEGPLMGGPVAGLEGHRVLVVDDVNDTGETLAVARERIAQLGPGEVRLAVLHEKAGSREAADFRAKAVEQWHWLLYQWAVVEDSRSFVESLDPRPQTSEEVRKRLDEEFGLVFPDLLWQTVGALLTETV